MIRHLLLSLAIYSVSVTTAAQSTDLAESIEQFIQQKLPAAQVGVVLQAGDSGDILYQRQADHYFYPASNTKLFLAAAALKTLGKDFTFKTYLLQNGKDIYLQFNGDPSLTFDQLNQLISKLKQSNITAIEGNFLIDDSAFQQPYYAQGWTWDSIPWYYSAPVGSIIINENKTPLHIKEVKQAKQSVLFDHNGAFPAIKVNANVTSVPKVTAEQDCQLNVKQERNELYLDGCWPYERTPHTVEVSMQDPHFLAEQAVEQILTKHNISLKGKVSFDKTPKNSKIISAHQSATLSALLKPVLQDSNNLVTDAITKTLGIAYANEGSFLQGVNAIKASLSEAYNLPSDQYRLFDGSGVSRYTLIAPSFINELLYQMTKDPDFTYFHQALSRAGENGSLQYRMKDVNLSKKIAAKTGTAMGTSALSGYLMAKSGKIYVFTIVINQALDKTENLKLIEDQLCLLLYERL